MRRVLSVVAVAALIVLAGCGGDDDDESTSDTTVAPAVTTTVLTFTGEGSQEFCAIARANIASVQQAVLAYTANPTDGQALLEEVAPKVRETAAKAPAEIKSATTVLADSFDQFLEDKDYTILNTDEFKQASAALTAYGNQVCGLRP